MSLLKSTVVYAALVAAGVGLSGCAVTDLLNKSDDDIGGGGTKILKSGPAVAVRTAFEATCADSSTAEDCDTETSSVNSVVTKGASVIFAKGETEASVTIANGFAGMKNLDNLPKATGQSGIDKYTKVVAEHEFQQILNVSANDDGIPQDDEFFTFVGTDSVTGTRDGNSVEGVYDKTIAVVGDLTPSNKLKTATFKGKGQIEGNAFALGTDPDDGDDLYAKGDLTLNANLQDKTIVGGIVDLQGHDEDYAYKGGRLELQNGVIDGSQFGEGQLVLKKANGDTAVDFGANSAFVGGFYGDDMEFAAGVFAGSKVQDGKMHQIEGIFAGEIQAD